MGFDRQETGERGSSKSISEKIKGWLRLFEAVTKSSNQNDHHQMMMITADS